jgi:hypothetical protein
LAEFVGEAAKVRGVRAKVGVIEKPENPATFTQSPMVADCDTCRSSDKAMLVPVTVRGDGKFTVAVGGKRL